MALSNATGFQREHVVAEVLQHAVLPDYLPTVGGLHLDAEYRAGAAGTYVGGDWYDVFRLDDQNVVFSVGDVMGKGAPGGGAHGPGAQRHTRLRRRRADSVRGALTSLDQLFDVLGEDRVVTAVVGSVNPSSGSVRLANAGHPSPLLVRADGHSSFFSSRTRSSSPPGSEGRCARSSPSPCRPGDSLVMYSDGLVERRGELISLGMQRLAEAATEVAISGWPARPAAALASRMDDDEQADDVVVLALRYAGMTLRG